MNEAYVVSCSGIFLVKKVKGRQDMYRGDSIITTTKEVHPITKTWPDDYTACDDCQHLGENCSGISDREEFIREDLQ